MFAIDFKGLSAIERNKAHSMLGHPKHGGKAFLYNSMQDVCICAITTHRDHFVIKLIFGVSAKVAVA